MAILKLMPFQILVKFHIAQIFVVKIIKNRLNNNRSIFSLKGLLVC